MTTLIDKLEYNPDPALMERVPLSAHIYEHADSRHISRVLKQAGLKRAERIQGGDYYTWGYRVSHSQLSIAQESSYRNEESAALMEQCVAVLRDNGFVVVESRYNSTVFKETDDVPIYSLHGTYVAVGSTLVEAQRVPAFVAESKRRKDAIAAAEAEEKRVEQLRVERRLDFAKALHKAGLDTELVGYGKITIDADDLANWLKGQGIDI